MSLNLAKKDKHCTDLKSQSKMYRSSEATEVYLPIKSFQIY